MDYDIEIAYYSGKANLVVDALSRRPMLCGARLAVMGIQFDDQRANVSIKELIVVMTKLAISPTMLDRII